MGSRTLFFCHVLYSCAEVKDQREAETQSTGLHTVSGILQNLSRNRVMLSLEQVLQFPQRRINLISSRQILDKFF